MSPRLALNLAITYKGQGRLEEARDLLERTLIAQPDYPLARSHLASTLTALGQQQEANQVMAASVAAAPPKSKSIPARGWPGINWPGRISKRASLNRR